MPNVTFLPASSLPRAVPAQVWEAERVHRLPGKVQEDEGETGTVSKGSWKCTPIVNGIKRVINFTSKTKHDIKMLA